MGLRKFKIRTINKFEVPVVGYYKRIYDSKNRPLIINPGRDDLYTRSPNIRSINIHEIDQGNDQIELLRNITESINIEIKPEWENEEDFYERVESFINDGEKPTDVLAISISLVCPKINYVIDNRIIELSRIDKKEPIRFDNILLDDIVGNIEISSELIRIKNSNPSDPLVAHSKLSVLAENEDITFYVDEIEIVGGNSLEIRPDDTGSKMFVIKNIDVFGVNPPTLVYNKEFKEYFHAGDDYFTVQVIMLLIGMPYCEYLLRWILFGIPDFSNPAHQGLIKFIAQLCDIKVTEIQEISETSEKSYKEKEYFKLSSSLFDNIQGTGKGWKKSLHNIILKEKNG